ncbi:hypothetical protein KIH39_08115 [Telmatocola sphagniphila]|uniref:Uncharacterized protein n=1 Tax=Telmatocola sphagniphila TaxID=1123043 RepID=A0A8E6B9H8_9BACT|nr:hypothetical protein [Telmatocola sphagniphila]QVL33857.1 hypothetical protein KIH39_08115 [Telmatocola sphagniphila]
MSNQQLVSGDAPELSVQIQSRDFQNWASYMAAWSNRLDTHPRNWDELELLDFVDQLQRRTYFWQKEIEDNFVEMDSTDETIID